MKKNQPKVNPRKYSSLVLDGPERAPAAPCFMPSDSNRKISRSRSSASPRPGAWSRRATCTFDKLALEAENGANAAGGKAIIFNTITISDGISMGTEGMKYSLVSREVIADSIETVVGCEGMDGFVAIGGCDKNMPGAMMAIARMNRPAVFVYGGTILPGCITGDTAQARHRFRLRSRRRARQQEDR